MTEQLTTQHYVPEWHTDEGVRIIVARVYIGSKRTSAYVPMPPEHWPDGVLGDVYQRVQEMYREDDAKQFWDVKRVLYLALIISKTHFYISGVSWRE